MQNTEQTQQSTRHNLAKKYYPGETKEERKARKAREKATGVKENMPVPKRAEERAPEPVPNPTPKPDHPTKQQRKKLDNKREDKFFPAQPDPVDKTEDRWAPGFSPDSKRYVVCLKHGNKYSAEYVNKLFWMVRRNLTLPFEFVCFTENPQDLDPAIRVEPLPRIRGIGGWWFKPMFFNPDLNIKGTILFLDLDVIVFENIDKLFTYAPGHFCIIRDFNRKNQPHWQKFNSSCFRLETGQHSQVYTEYWRDPEANSRKFHGDQDWIYHMVKTNFTFWPDDWLQSYKWEMRNKPPMTRVNGVRNFVSPGTPQIKPDTAIAVFHGEPNPHNCVDQWCKDNWK